MAKTASKSMLANQYDVSVRTLMHWLSQAGHTTFGQRKTLMPKEVAGIYQILGPPYIQLDMTHT